MEKKGRGHAQDTGRHAPELVRASLSLLTLQACVGYLDMRLCTQIIQFVRMDTGQNAANVGRVSQVAICSTDNSKCATSRHHAHTQTTTAEHDGGMDEVPDAKFPPSLGDGTWRTRKKPT